MFNANDSSMNGTCNTYVQYSAQKTKNKPQKVLWYQTLVIDTPINSKTEMSYAII